MSLFDSVGHWVSNAVKTAGRGVGSAIGAVSHATGAIGKAIKSVPIVGGALHGLYDLEFGMYFKVADDIAKGHAIDRVVMDHLKHELADVREIAPYAQTVIALVPGVGPGVAGAISAGLALASGQTISQAAVAAIRGSIPGGALAQAAFDVGHAALSSKRIDTIALNALPIAPEAKQALGSALRVAEDVAQGKRVDDAVLNEAYRNLPPAGRSAVDAAKRVAHGGNVAIVIADQARKALPPAAQKGLDIGMAVAQGQKLQAIASQHIQSGKVGQTLATAGLHAIGVDHLLHAASSMVPQGSRGFAIGAGLMQQHIGVHTFEAVRNTLSGQNQKAFDLVTSLHIGRVTTKAPKKILASIGHPPEKTPPANQAAVGYYATRGMMGAPPDNKQSLMTTLVNQGRATEAGAKEAVAQVNQARQAESRSLWQRIVDFLFGK